MAPRFQGNKGNSSRKETPGGINGKSLPRNIPKNVSEEKTVAASVEKAGAHFQFGSSTHVEPSSRANRNKRSRVEGIPKQGVTSNIVNHNIDPGNHSHEVQESHEVIFEENVGDHMQRIGATKEIEIPVANLPSQDEIFSCLGPLSFLNSFYDWF